MSTAVIGVSVAAFGLPHVYTNSGDQEVYALAAERVVRGETFYRPDQMRAFTYPPFCVLQFVPMVGLDEITRRGIWYLVNFTLLGLVVFLVRQAVLPMRTGSKWATFASVALTVLLAARFVVSPLEYQGHDQVVFTMSLLGILAWTRERDAGAGVWTGLAAASKATPALFLPVFVWNRRFRAATAFVLAAAGGTLLVDVMFPAKTGVPWALEWYAAFVSKVDVGKAADASGAWISWNMLNQSLAGSLYRISTPVDVTTPHLFDVSLWSLGEGGLRVVTLVGQAGVLLLVLRTTWPGWVRDVPEEERAVLRFGQAGAVLCGMLLLSPMSSKPHFCTLVAPVAFVVADFVHRRRDPVVGVGLAVFFAAGTLTAKGLLGKAVGDRALAYGALTWTTLALLIMVSHCVRTRSRQFGTACETGTDGQEVGNGQRDARPPAEMDVASAA